MQHTMKMYGGVEVQHHAFLSMNYRVGREDVMVFRSDIREIRHMLVPHSVDGCA
jgi:hypothetical protein